MYHPILDRIELERKPTDWKEQYIGLIQSIGSATYGKERWFIQDGEIWYDRKEADYITIDEMERRVRSAILEEME